MIVKTYSAAVNGLEVTTVTIEISMTRGVLFHLSGLADTAVKESRDRIVAALQNNGFKFPVADITVNMAPADLRKEGSGYDLPLAIGILAAMGKVNSEMLDKYMLVGELGLDGRLQPVRGALPISIRARKEEFKGLIVPKQNIREAAVISIHKNKQMSCADAYLSTLVVARRSSYATYIITIHRQTGYVYHSTSNTFVRFTLTTDAECKGVTREMVGIKGTNAIAILHTGKIYQIDKCVNLIKLFALQHTTNKSLT